jgi:hypothetical protein
VQGSRHKVIKIEKKVRERQELIPRRDESFFNVQTKLIVSQPLEKSIKLNACGR